MAKFYFTYGSDDQFPFRGGWTEVEAANRIYAVAAFRAIHPDVHENVINCADVYDEKQFAATCMADGTGNMHAFCHERISLSVEKTDPTEVIKLT